MTKYLGDKKVEWTNQLYDVLVDLSKNKEIKSKVIYTWQGFYDFLKGIQKEERPNRFMHEIRSPQIVRVCSSGREYLELKEKYKALRKGKQVECSDGESKELEFEELIASEFSTGQLKEYLKSGCPHSKRVELYLNVFEIEDS